MGLLDDAIREHLELKRLRGGDPAEIERAEREALGPVRRGPEALDPAAAEPGYELHEEAEYLPHDATESELHEEPEPQAAELVLGLAPEYELESEHGYELHDEPLHEPLEGPGIGGSEYEHEEAVPEHGHALEPDWEEHAIELEPPETAVEPPLDSPPTELMPLVDAPEPHEPEFHEPGLHEPEPHEPEPEQLEEPPSAAAHEPEPPAPDRSQETVEYDLEEHPEGKDADVLEETPDFLQDTPEHDRLWFEQRPPRDFDFEG